MDEYKDRDRYMLDMIEGIENAIIQKYAILHICEKKEESIENHMATFY